MLNQGLEKKEYFSISFDINFQAALKDRERIEQLRLRERIGSYHKYVDNALVNNPDPTSSHFLPGTYSIVKTLKPKLLYRLRQI